MDQLVAKALEQHTQIGSLELGLDSRDVSGSCDVGFACIYTNTISWRSATTPLPTENNPRVVFERLFGDTGSTEARARLARIQEQRSILDSVAETIGDLNRRLGPQDRVRMDQFLDGVRDVERRIQKAEQQGARELPVLDEPAGIPASYEEHAKLMFDLQVLAYQSDLTRVITFMLGRELSGRTYPQIGVLGLHNPTSPHGEDPEMYDMVATSNESQLRLFEYYLEKLRSTPDGDCSLLDHLLILYGAGMSDPNQHARTNLPLVLVGGGVDRVRGGRHIVYPEDTPMANLSLAVLELFDVHLEKLGISTGKLDVEPLSFSQAVL